MFKMKAIHTKQQNVLKRKVEEAEALNNRLKSMLAMRKHAQESKIHGKIERIGPWLTQEFEVFINLEEAEATHTGLLENRATLQHQLDELRGNLDTADTSEVKSIEDIELRSVQIQDLQQKQLLDSDEGPTSIL